MRSQTQGKSCRHRTAFDDYDKHLLTSKPSVLLAQYKQSQLIISLGQKKKKTLIILKTEKSLIDEEKNASMNDKKCLTPFKERLPKVHSFLNQNISEQKQKIDKFNFSSLNITTKSWSLFDIRNNKSLGFRQDYKRQIASLTKIMTTLLAIQIIQKLQLSKQCMIKVTATAASMIGTSAQLKPNHWISLQDLLFGVMLPSGNDAAFSISEYIGHCLILSNSKSQDYFRSLRMMDLTKQNTSIFVQQFIRCMNQKTVSMELLNTRFSNPHGLQNAMNTSSAKDIIKLSIAASKNTQFRTIMNSVYYKYQLFDADDMKKRSLKRWWNTNKLLEKGWEGVKTGQTTAAGSCLSSLRENVYIVVLNCLNASTRFSDTQTIYEWYRNKLQSMPAHVSAISVKSKLLRIQTFQTEDSI